MQTADLLWTSLLGLVSGLSIGCVGVGGVILVPSLFFLLNVPVHTAIPAAMMAYILSGIVGTTVFARNRSIDWRMAGWLCLGAAPTAFLGAWTVHAVNSKVLQLCIGAVTLFSGANALWTRRASNSAEGFKLVRKFLAPIGGATGFLSALSGTGGPLVLVPLLISMRVPVLTTVGLSQAIQLPIAFAATFGNVLYGKLDIALGSTLAVALTVGSWFGAKLAHSVPRATMQRVVAIVLVLVGIFIFVNVGRQFLVHQTSHGIKSSASRP